MVMAPDSLTRGLDAAMSCPHPWRIDVTEPAFGLAPARTANGRSIPLRRFGEVGELFGCQRVIPQPPCNAYVRRSVR